MKTKNKILLASFILFSINNCFAQLKVFSNNKVQIGPLWSSTPPNEQLFLNGGAYLNCLPALGGMSIINFNNLYLGTIYDDPSITPQHANSAWLGTPTKQLFRVFSNEVYGNQVLLFSDSSLKTNIQPLTPDSCLKKIIALKAYKYDYKLPTQEQALATDSISTKYNLRYLEENKNQIGLTAQELKLIIPEAVKQNNETGNYSVNYIMLIPMLIESIKKQQEQINLLQQEVILLKNP